jgi:N-acetylmuramoyl-L-alanine amidase
MPFFAALLSLLLGFVPWLGAPTAADAPTAGEVTVALNRGSGPRAGDPPILGSPNPNRPLIVLDAGHGGHDPGATSVHDGAKEKEIVLALVRAIRDELVRTKRVRVALTRDEDRFIALRERYEIARRLGADLFISVHADAAPLNDLARGATVYTLSEVASDREAALLARAENSADLIGGVALKGRDAAVNTILIDLAQRESMDVSAAFARLVQREAEFPLRPEPHRFASLMVLKRPTCRRSCSRRDTSPTSTTAASSSRPRDGNRSQPACAARSRPISRGGPFNWRHAEELDPCA